MEAGAELCGFGGGWLLCGGCIFGDGCGDGCGDGGYDEGVDGDGVVDPGAHKVVEGGFRGGDDPDGYAKEVEEPDNGIG